MIAIKTANRLLEDLFWPQFLKKGGCVFLASTCPDRVVLDDSLPDRTSLESFHNHLHLLDGFRHGATLREEPFFDAEHPDFQAACAVGKTVAALWRAKLSHDFPSERFLVYFTAHDDPIVRFHVVRPGEPPWLEPSEWPEDVAAGRVLVLPTGPVSADPAA